MDFKIKLTNFSGNQKKLERWSKKFLAKARLRGCRQVILGYEMVDKDGRNFEQVKLKNDLAYAELMICCENDLCFSIVDNNVTELFPEGDCFLAWKNLVARYEPRTKSNLIQLKKELMESKLEDIGKDLE